LGWSAPPSAQGQSMRAERALSGSPMGGICTRLARKLPIDSWTFLFDGQLPTRFWLMTMLMGSKW
jgi:hypothetical protein